MKCLPWILILLCTWQAKGQSVTSLQVERSADLTVWQTLPITSQWLDQAGRILLPESAAAGHFRMGIERVQPGTISIDDSTITLRFGFWNTFNNPDDETEAAGFRTIFTSMPKIDLLGVAETDHASALMLDSILSGITGTDWNSVTGSSVAGDMTGVFWNPQLLMLVESGQFATGLTRPVTWTKFRPVGTAGEADFTYAAAHLKSGSTNSDKTTRANEANAITGHLATLNSSAIILAGDFNWLGASEQAYGNFTTSGLSDIANRPGEWRNNSLFKDLHTQSPGTALDDRFDMILANAGLTDGLGIDYMPGSFDVFGNDGSHVLGQPLTANSEADATTVQALRNASDHLPIHASFAFTPELISTPAAFLDLEKSTDLVNWQSVPVSSGMLDGGRILIQSTGNKEFYRLRVTENLGGQP